MKDSTAQWLVGVGFGTVIGGIIWVNAPSMGKVTSREAELDRYLASTLENASGCRAELHEVRRSLEATQKVCREEVLERQKKCEAGLCQ